MTIEVNKDIFSITRYNVIGERLNSNTLELVVIDKYDSIEVSSRTIVNIFVNSNLQYMITTKIPAREFLDSLLISENRDKKVKTLLDEC